MSNQELSKLSIYKGKCCAKCGRKCPETVLNIEGVIHHNVKQFVCIDTKECNRRRKKIKTKSK